MPHDSIEMVSNHVSIGTTDFIIVVNRYDQSMYLSTIRWQWMFIFGILHGYNQVVYIDNIYMGHMACLRFFSMVNRYDQSVYLCTFMKVGLMDMIIICYDHMIELIELKRDQTSDQNHRQ